MSGGTGAEAEAKGLRSQGPGASGSGEKKHLIGGIYHRTQRKRPLGAGSFAEVWEGLNSETREVVAIKMVSWDKLEKQQPRYLQRHKQQLRNEIECLQSLNHPNIVRLYYYKNTTRSFIMVLEFCAGGDLACAIRGKKGPVDEPVSFKLIKQLSEGSNPQTTSGLRHIRTLPSNECAHIPLKSGLKAMRDLNWVHRDLKPGNLLLSCKKLEDAVLKIGDFGFARGLASESLATTWVGSPLYMAPEILTRESGGYDAKADLWSVGCILFELTMGKQPYGSRADNHFELMEDIRTDRKYVPEKPILLSKSCEDLLDRLLQRVPAQRMSYEEFFSHHWLQADSNDGEKASLKGSMLLRSEMGQGEGVNTLLSQVMAPLPAHLPAAARSQEPKAQSKKEVNKDMRHAAAVPQDKVQKDSGGERAGGKSKKGSGAEQEEASEAGRTMPITPTNPSVSPQGPAARESRNTTAPKPAVAHKTAAKSSATDVQPSKPAGPSNAAGPGIQGNGTGDSGGHGVGASQVSLEDFEMVDGSYPCDPVLVEAEHGGSGLEGDTTPRRQGGGRYGGQKFSTSVAAATGELHPEVAAVALDMEFLIQDVVVCTREIVALANDRLRERTPFASQALALYLWSLQILHKALNHLQDVQSRSGNLIPQKFVSEWQSSLAGHLADDFHKAKLAMRMGIETSQSTEFPWITAQGDLNEWALSRPATPTAERIVYITAMKCARDAASQELLYSLPWSSARPLYSRAILLLCSLMLDSQGPVQDLKALSSYASLFVSRLEAGQKEQQQAGSLGLVNELLALTQRCSKWGRLAPWSAVRNQMTPSRTASGGQWQQKAR